MELELCNLSKSVWASEGALALFLSEPKQNKSIQAHIATCKGSCLKDFALATNEWRSKSQKVKNAFKDLCNPQFFPGGLHITKLINEVLEYENKKSIPGWDFEKAIQKSMSEIRKNENRIEQIKELANLGKNGSEKAVRSLIEILNDEDSDVRHSAAEVLGELRIASEKVGWEKVVNALVNALDDGDYATRSSSAEALGKLKDSSKEVVEILTLALKDENSEVRESVQKALNELKSFH